MESYQFKMQKMLKKYPDISKSFDNVVDSFSSNNFEYRASSMYKCLESIVDYIYSNCNADKCDLLFDKIEILYKSKIITETSYENYLSIIDYKYKYNYAARTEEDRVLRLLIGELSEFLTSYSVKVNKDISLGKQKIHDFFFYRLAGLMTLIIGIYGIYNEIKSSFMTYGIIIFSILALVGLLLLIGGKKIAKLWLKIRFGSDN